MRWNSGMSKALSYTDYILLDRSALLEHLNIDLRLTLLEVWHPTVLLYMP